MGLHTVTSGLHTVKEAQAKGLHTVKLVMANDCSNCRSRLADQCKSMSADLCVSECPYKSITSFTVRKSVRLCAKPALVVSYD